ncbi:MAG: radical SAM family heme chaperone HemW [Desulfovibrionaceae bacterium]
MLLYIHVPFCVKKCVYCAFHSVPLNAPDFEAYVSGLGHEIALWGDRLARAKVSTIFFGGGTPSLLPETVLADIFRKLERAFTIDPRAEVSFEGNPDSLAYGAGAYLATLKSLGVNRLSIGVQSFDDATLRLLGRAHDARQAVNAYRLARAAGFSNVSLDLIWGLPGQRLKLWLDELKKVVDLAPDHLSCYGLTIEPDTPLETMAFSHDMKLPSEDELARMFVHGGDYLESRGYLHYEVSNFAKMGFMCRHNQGYWEGRDYLGLGPSAVSTVNGLRWDNPRDIGQYARDAREARLGEKAEALTPDERARELIMLRLRTARGLRLKAYREMVGRDFVQEHRQLIHGLHRMGLARISQGYLRLTRNGMLVSNSILERFFDAAGTPNGDADGEA